MTGTGKAERMIARVASRSSARFVIRLTALLVALFLPVLGAAAETRVLRTEYFDFIFSPESEDSARLLASGADRAAVEICSLLGASMPSRVPVYVNPDREDFNAYFTPYLYNRIVVFDALPVDGPEAGSCDPLPRAFRHELTHLVSMNVRSPFWKAVSVVFGDVVSVDSGITMTPSFIEGVTVSLESADGAGRLNDPLVLHELAQAKLEGIRLTFKDTAGARDAYPGMQLAYYYGGAFSAWLQKTYGMETYARLWEKGGSFNPFMSWTWTRFAQVYPVSLNEAWSAFLESIEVPDSVSPRGERLSLTEDGILSCLASGPDGIVWADSNAGSVFFRDRAGRVNALFASDESIHRLALSPDGQYLLVSSFTPGASSSRDSVRVYDMKKRRFAGETFADLRDASFGSSAARVIAVRVSGQRSALVTFDRSSPDTIETLAIAGPHEPLSAIYSPTFVRLPVADQSVADGDSVAFIAVTSTGRRIVTVDGKTHSQSTVSFPFDAGYIRYLQNSPDGRVSFGWATKRDFYRYAVWDPETGMVRAQRDMASGACFYPVVDPSTLAIVCVSSFAESDSLSAFVGAAETEGLATVAADASVSADMPLAGETTRTGGIPASDGMPPAENRAYRPFVWFRDGVFYPYISSISTGYDETSFGARLTYMTEDPTETFGLSANCAYFPDQSFVDWSLAGTYSPSDAVVSLAVSDNLLSALPSDGPYRQLSADASLSTQAYCGTNWKLLSLRLGATAHWYSSDINDAPRAYDAPLGPSSVGAYAEAGYDAVKQRSLRSRPLFPEIATGWRTEAFAYAGVVFPDRESTYLAEALAELRVPFVPLSLELAVACADGLTFVPGVTLFRPDCVREYAWTGEQLYRQFPEYDATRFAGIGSDSVITANVELTAIDVSVQKGIPFLPLFANDACVSGGYRSGLFGFSGFPALSDLSGLSGETWAYLDSAFVAGTARASAVIGALTRVVFSARVEYACPLRAGEWYRTITFGAKIPY
jgi:hypothetical protein